MTKLYPYLNFAGNAEEVLEFYRSVFGGEFSALVRFGDMPMPGMEIPEPDRNKVMHMSLPIGDGDVLMASDALTSLGQQVTQGNSSYICVSPSSRDEADKLFNGLSAGGDIEMPLADQAWGDYFGSFKDKFGTGWMINYSEPNA